MAASISVTTNAGALAVRYQDASAVYAQTLLKAMRQIERETIRGLKTSIGIVLRRRTGLMARRVRGRFTLAAGEPGAGGTIDLKVRSGAWYAKGHEQGATRTPTRAAHLAIPLFGLADARRFGEGRDASNRLTARKLIESPGTYGFSGTFTRNGVIFGRLLDHNDVVPMFALKRSITLSPRRPHQTTREIMAPRVRELLGDAVAEASQAVSTGREAAV